MTDFKHIILWRHEEARPASYPGSLADLHRDLTHHGFLRARKTAKWLKRELPKPYLVVSSFATRAALTAIALKSRVILKEVLNPNAQAVDVLKWLHAFEREMVRDYPIDASLPEVLIIVGHQPWLGQLASYLAGMGEQEAPIKKGAVWWLRLDNSSADINKTPAQYQLYTVQAPDLLR